MLPLHRKIFQNLRNCHLGMLSHLGMISHLGMRSPGVAEVCTSVTRLTKGEMPNNLLASTWMGESTKRPREMLKTLIRRSLTIILLKDVAAGNCKWPPLDYNKMSDSSTSAVNREKQLISSGLEKSAVEVEMLALSILMYVRSTAARVRPSPIVHQLLSNG